MSHFVTLNLSEASEKLEAYSRAFPQKKVPSITLPQEHISSSDLDRLALIALHPEATLAVYYAYQPVFLDIIARWVQNTAWFEGNYCELQRISPPPPSGSIVLLALSRVIDLEPSSANLIEHFLKNSSEILGKLIDPTLPKSDLHSSLLAYYRLFNSRPHKFKPYIDLKRINAVINSSANGSNDVSKLLAIKIFCKYTQASESAQEAMLQTHIKGSTEANFDGGYIIDYRFLPLVEAKRLSNHTKLPSISLPQGTVCKIPQTELSPLVTCVCGVLLFNVHPKESSPSKDDFVAIDSSVEVLKKLASELSKDKPVMLYGQPGSGKTFLINQMARYMNCSDNVVKIHLGEQTDAKLLLGTYTSGEKPGSFSWRSGVLTTAVKEGKWVLVEDINKAPTEVLSILLVLLEKRELNIPSRGEVIKAHSGFQLISTITTSSEYTDKVPDLIGLRLWSRIEVPALLESDLRAILVSKFPLLKHFVPKFIMVYKKVLQIFSMPAFISLNKGSHPRYNSTRDLLKFCSRCAQILRNKGITSEDSLLETSVYEDIFAEAVECFGSALTEASASVPLMNAIGEVLEIPSTRIKVFIDSYVPSMHVSEDSIQIGRALLKKSMADQALYKRTKVGQGSFARTKHSKRLMEQIALAIEMVEPVLLVGETGTGKTTVVQEIAKMMNKKMTAINVSQQTESSDLVGGYKPVNTMTVALPIQESFETLFLATFSQKKNAKFSQLLSKCFNKKQWKNVIKLWKEAFKMANAILSKTDDSEEENEEDGAPKKKRKLNSTEKHALLDRWIEFKSGVERFEAQAANLESSFVFDFVEGSLVKAIRNGEWLLLDEINLASADTLESIADLLSDASEQRSILLSERGDIDAIKAHPDFRIFGCMNPSTDVGKRDLPAGIRSRFSEIYVHSPDRDREDLLQIIDKYIDRYAVGDDWVADDIAELYVEAKSLADKNKIVDGANQKPHFSIRTLTRTLTYVCDIVGTYGLRRSLYEGFCMSFLTLLDVKSESVLRPIIEKYTIGKTKNPKAALSHIPKAPTDGKNEYVQFKHYWLRKGAFEIDSQPNYIITPFVEKNLLNLVRATASSRFPVLVQGPTSAGKTSMINYLAAISGHKFVRINNHEHTDLQEYLGTYVSDSSGKLVFREGILVEALRKGYWIVLDELNLAPTDVLEALNRLLDDNRELFIPETQEVIRPHPDFMLFATQNPPGAYGGRKVLSRAFRNRFLELHFDDIPREELEIILRDRCKIAPSHGKKIVEVYNELSLQRQSSRLFEQKNSFATLRDLFRWALRDAVGYEELAANGYMLLAERVRNEEEKRAVKTIIEKVMRVKLDMDAFYEKLEDKAVFGMESSIVWTKAMRRLAVLVETSIKYKEPLLLVGETGCGKTTVCQILAHFKNKQLITVNAHQNTETGDILGAQRPLRNRFENRGELVKNLVTFFEKLGLNIDLKEANAEDLTAKYHQTIKKLSLEEKEELGFSFIEEIEQNLKNASTLFEWVDGPLVKAMQSGDFFLLDEISLADDSVLERLNSVLEPERSLFLAEKGTEDALKVAHDEFSFLATMNPGGDYGKKELSPALRNRFTEIWVPSLEDFSDVKQIVDARLKPAFQPLSSALTEFSEWFGRKLGNGNVNSGVISLRDILAWVEFINSCNESISREEAFYHGASLVFIDALGTNNTAYLAENEAKLAGYKAECVEHLSSLINTDVSRFSLAVSHEISLSETAFKAGLFEVPRLPATTFDDQFNLDAPTTATNASRVIRAMQVHKPILLEGSPGVGKTSLISAIAKATGNPLIRINLSEQTDLIDLFGSDAPVEGGSTGEFVWRDAPFLRAMKHGEWVLLDEMNLASQSVLEGLNACLDHRGEAYIPELDRSFPRHPDFKVFAAQNPQYQGGGRKGLPKSFVNRFTVVYVDTLNADDLTLISHKVYPNIPQEDCKKLIMFISALEQQVVSEKSFGVLGGPWEFNLRDVLRWLSSFNSLKNINPQSDMKVGDFLEMIIESRFRTEADRVRVREIYGSIFGVAKKETAYFSAGLDYVQAGRALIKRESMIQFDNSTDDTNLVSLQCNHKILESALRSVNEKIPFILTGPSNAGKTDLIRFLANSAGVKLAEFAMNSDVDSMDILGGYEQVDITRAMSEVVAKTHSLFRHLVIQSAFRGEQISQAATIALDLIHIIETCVSVSECFEDIYSKVKGFMGHYHNEDLSQLLGQYEEVRVKAESSALVRFEWFDGLLVKAVANGDWLVLDNANLCNPSVLDRLNSLLEHNGSLIINECSAEDGMPRVLTPHPNFRLFLTVNPKYGELSRAMRNRCIEVYIDDLEVRSTAFDKAILGMQPEPSARENGDLCDMMEDLKVDQRLVGKPLAAFLPSSETRLRQFIAAVDAIDVCDRSLCKSVLVSNFAQSDIGLVESWSNTVIHSAEFNETSKVIFEQSLGVLRLLFDADYFSSCKELYSNIDESRTSRGFPDNQKLNVLINEVIVPYLNTTGTVNWLEPTLMFQVATNLFEASLQLRSIEQTASEGTLSSLSFLETSAAVNIGREVKRVPKVDVYGFVKKLFTWTYDVFMKNATATTDYSEATFSALLDLQLVWNALVASASVQSITKLRVYHTLVDSWFEKHKGLKSLSKDAHDLPSLSLGLELSHGLSMKIIWDAFRQLYPSSSETWTYYSSFLEVISEFDSLIAKHDMDVNEVMTLRELMVDLHSTIIEGTASGAELSELFESLQKGVTELKNAASNSDKRHNEFEVEFSIISNLVETTSSITGQKTFKTQLQLYKKSNKPTLALVYVDKASLFQPYPRFLEDFWNKGQAEGVESVFGEALLRSTNVKTKNLDKCPGKFLDRQLSDMELLAKALVQNSSSILQDQREVFRRLLQKWAGGIFEAHGINVKQIGTEGQSKTILVNELLEIIRASGIDHLVKVFEAYLGPAILLTVDSDSLKDLGKAWILFSTGCLQLYVPSSPLDPAIDDHIAYDVFKAQELSLSDLKESWRAMRSVSIGEEVIRTEEALSGLDAPKREKPEIYRPVDGIDDVFEEWSNFMSSSINEESVQRMLSLAAADQYENAANTIGVFQQNSKNFLTRLRINKIIYSDLNDILAGYVYGLKLGFSLMTMANEDSQARLPLDNLWSVDAAALLHPSNLKNTFEQFTSASKHFESDSAASEKSMLFFVNLCFQQSSKTAEPEIEHVVNSAFKTLYYRWSYRRAKEEERAAQEGSLYKFDGADEDVDKEFRELFPDYEEVMDIDNKVTKFNDSITEVYPHICEVYVNYYLSRSSLDVASIVQQGASLAAELSKIGDLFRHGENTSSSLAAVLLNIFKSHETYSVKSSSDVDFYHHESPVEFRKAMRVISSVYRAVAPLLEQWPEHATLQDIARTATEFMEFPSSFPVSRLLQKIEVIFTYINEWEKFASSKVSLKECYEELTQLIVSWRKLELSTWKNLFGNEDATYKKNIGKWWFHLFETIIVPIISNDDGDENEKPSAVQLLGALNVFMSEATYGEFLSRLELVKAFKNHAKTLVGGEHVASALHNFVVFYEQFLPQISEGIASNRKVLEKDIAEVILLASWKDVNIDALKQSSRRSHASLFKIVRKYRAVLATSVTPIIQAGLSADNKVICPDIKAITTMEYLCPDHSTQQAILRSASKAASWDERPNRLKNLSNIEHNMKVFIERVSRAEAPSLYDYAKEVIEEMDRLKKETPSVMNDETKKVVAALKAQKHKLLSEVLKELRRIGIKTTVKVDVKKVLATVNLIFANMAPFSSSSLAGIDTYIMRVLDLLPRLRASIASGNEDIPQPDLERGLAATENLTFSLVTIRGPVANLTTALESINSVNDGFSNIIMGPERPSIQLCSPASVEAFFPTLENLQGFVLKFEKMLDYSITVSESIIRFTGQFDLEVLSKVRDAIINWRARLSITDVIIPTKLEIELLQDFKAFIDEAEKDVIEWGKVHPEHAFVAEILLSWLAKWDYHLISHADASATGFSNVVNLEKQLRQLSNSILVCVQKVVETHDSDISSDDDEWFKLSQRRIAQAVKALHHERILKLVLDARSTILQMHHDDETSSVCSGLISFTLPLVQLYHKLAATVLEKAKSNYIEVSRSTYVMASALHNLSTNGFCSPEPPQEQKKDDKLQEGTGLGDGEGATNNSKDADEDDDLDEHAQQPNKDEKDKDDGEEDENDDAVEMDGDMAGELENASDQEKDDDEEGDEEDLDEEIDNLDDLDPNAVDEKMWDEEQKDDAKEKDSDKMPQNSLNDDDDMEAMEDEENQNQDDKGEENSKDNDGESGDEEEDVGEQEDEVKNDENEQLDDYVPETEALELPEEMNLDNEDDEDAQDEENNDEEIQDGLDEDEDSSEQKEVQADDQAEVEENDAENDAMEEEDEGEQDAEDDAEGGDGVDEEAIDEEPQNDDSDEEAVGGQEQEEEEKNDEDSAERGEQDADGLDGAEQDQNEDIDMDAASRSAMGERGDGADEEVLEDQDDIGASGSASHDMKQEENKDQDSNNNNSSSEIKESLKQLGDSLKEFHRRREEIKEANEQNQEETEKKADVKPDEFQHVEGENTEQDTQALGSADNMDQVQHIDEDKAIDDDADTDVKPEDQNEESGQDKMDTEDADLSGAENDMNADEQEAAENLGAIIGERRSIKQEEMELDLEQDDLEETRAELEMKAHVDHDVELGKDASPAHDLNHARELWNNSELATQELSAGLCEQLRLILEPTLATKLRGDYKTGKRLNMKRIIPYIASDFRKDKIWLRRTKPSKRQYQIMISVDNSKSMSESKVTDITLQSIALVSKALTQLESGGLSIVRFGEDVKLLHPFDRPFTQETGAKVFQWLDFQQERTDIKSLCSKSLKIFENARATSGADLWQLEIIISDGICEDHETVERLVRQARDEKVMLVFVVIDGITSNESILDMSQVSYVPDANTGAMSLKVNKYLDTFPFEFYVVVRSVSELPEMLSLILRQYFTEVANV